MLGLLLSVLIGLSLGLVGGGGSMVTIPVLVYVLGVEAHQAIAMALVIVGTTSLGAAAMHYRRNNVRLPAALLFGGAGIAGSYLGSRLTGLLSAHVLLLLFSLLMVIVGVTMLKGRSSQRSGRKIHLPALRWMNSIWAGFFVGTLTGFLGVGGGFLIVPAFMFLSGLEVKPAMGTSPVVIAMNSFSGVVAHRGELGGALCLAGMVTAAALVGTVGGSLFAHKASPQLLRKVFAWLVIAIGLAVGARNLWELLH